MLKPVKITRTQTETELRVRLSQMGEVVILRQRYPHLGPLTYRFINGSGYVTITFPTAAACTAVALQIEGNPLSLAINESIR